MEPLTDSLQDPARLAALADTQLPDSAAEESFDRLTRMVTRLLGVPVALVSLVDDNRQFLVLAETGKQASIQFFKSQQGLQGPGQPATADTPVPLVLPARGDRPGAACRDGPRNGPRVCDNLASHSAAPRISSLPDGQVFRATFMIPIAG